jgi:hypothetical protein
LDVITGVEITSRQVLPHILPVVHARVLAPAYPLGGRKLPGPLGFVEEGGELEGGVGRGRGGKR